MGRLDGKVAFITGGTRGIGRAVAVAYAREGATVAVCGRDEGRLLEVAREIHRMGAKVSVHACDLSQTGEIAPLVNQLCGFYGALDVVVNNASMLGPRQPVSEYPLSAWEEVLRVNLTAPFALAREAVRLMAIQRSGSIINVSSGVGRVGKAGWGAYSVSKFGIEGLTQVLAAEAKPYNVRVNAINPGATRTDMRAAAYPDEDPLTLPEPQDIVEGFVYLAADDSTHVTGQSFEAREWHT